MVPAAVLFLTAFGSVVSAYRILIIYPTASISHQLPAMGLTEAMVKEGHDVFVLSPNVVPGLEKNYTHIDFSWAYEFTGKCLVEKGVNLQKTLSKWDWFAFWDMYSYIMRKEFESDVFQQFYRRVKEEGIEFDVIVTESFAIPYGVGIARLLTGLANKPVVSLATLPNGDFYGEDAIGNILHLSYSPSVFSSYTDRMSVWQRIENWASQLYISRRLMQIMADEARGFFKDTYGPSAAAFVDDCYANVSLALVASNSLYYYPRQVSPNVVEVGPLHIKTIGKLPKDLQDWLDGSEKGVIYFSLGSNMRSSALPETVRLNFLKVFSELPAGYQVLWKWEKDANILGQPKNILPYTWIPQQDVLAHPKVKLFITQGGCQSFQEAVHYGVPTVGIPWFADQELNVAKMVDTGIGVRVRPHELYSIKSIKSAIETVLLDKRFATNMKKLSQMSHDFTYRAHDTAVFWVEHVAKHGGAKHLRPSTAETTYFQFFCLDILFVIAVTGCFAFYIFVVVFKLVISTLFSSGKAKIKSC